MPPVTFRKLILIGLLKALNKTIIKPMIAAEANTDAENKGNSKGLIKCF